MGSRNHAKPVDGRILVGIIGAAHGLQGAVRVRSYTAHPDDIAQFGPLWDISGQRRYSLTILRPIKNSLLCRVEGIKDRNAAEALRGTELYAERNQLAPLEDDQEYYHVDLIGMTAVQPDGRVLGALTAIHDFGAGDLLEIQRPEQGSLLVPFTNASVPEIDLSAGRMVVEPPAGLLEPQARESDGLTEEERSDAEKRMA